MRASELIDNLESAIEDYGDADVVMIAEGGWIEVNPTEVHFRDDNRIAIETDS